MTNTKSTKRALLASVMAMLLCFTMLLGTTFAWFTDSVTVSGNKIQSGTLDIALEMWNGTEWVNAEGQTLNFISANGETDILWEPGCTYQLPKLRVVNKGNLAAKYQVQVTGIAGDAKLNEAIKWYGYYEVNQYGVQSLQRLPWNTFASQQYMVTPAGETWQNIQQILQLLQMKLRKIILQNNSLIIGRLWVLILEQVQVSSLRIK